MVICSNPTGETFISTTFTTTKIFLANALIAGSATAFAQTSEAADATTMPRTGENQPTIAVGVTL